MPKKKPTNPFYVLLLIAGATFAITAMAYGVMTVRQLQESRTAGYGPSANGDYSVSEGNNFNEILDRYGSKLMVVELVLLTIGTFGAIAYDQHLDRKEAQSETPSSNPEGTI